MGRRAYLLAAEADRVRAERIAELLRGEGIEAVLDGAQPGDSAVAFVEEALSTSDYCLLLWSAAAAAGPWIQATWQVALHRSVMESRSFLVVGRLDEHPLPQLLSPRLYVELSPTPQAGVRQLADAWRADRAAERRTARPVAGPHPPARPGDQVYVSSGLFAVTLPWRAVLDEPAGVLLTDVVRHLDLPARLGEPPLSLAVRYDLALGDTTLTVSLPLREQGVRSGDVLWLQTTAEPVAAVAPLSAGALVYRDDFDQLRQLLLPYLRKARVGYWRPSGT